MTFLDLPHGIPSHTAGGTFGRVFGPIDPDAFEKLFVCWSDGLAQGVQHRRIAIDGKTLRRSMDKATGKAAVYMVSAFLARACVLCAAWSAYAGQLWAVWAGFRASLRPCGGSPPLLAAA